VPPYIPCRSQSLRTLDAQFPVSEAGRSYVAQRYREQPKILETARLGVRDPCATSAASTDGTLRIVSCSLMVSVKRLDRLVDGLAWAGRARPAQRIEWTHFGNGPLRAELEERASALPGNVRGRIVPYSSRRDLLTTYLENPTDVFVNVSASEGIPVTIMEAISCGIPVVATMVGGNPEIVTHDNGLLVGANPSPEELGNALLRFVDEPAQAQAWRHGSRRVWSERYDAEKNFRDFAGRLRALAP
jgi:glycosyltransferase involved in cell wall biosynthesis